MGEISAGGVIIKDGKVAVVSQVTSFSLPKGHLEEGETILEAAYREIFEETGLKKEELEFVKELGSYERPDGHTGNMKKIHWFLFKTEKEILNPVMKEENPEAFWVDLDKVVDYLGWHQDKEFFTNNKEHFVD